MRIHVQISNFENKKHTHILICIDEHFQQKSHRSWTEVTRASERFFWPNSDHEQQNYKYPGTTMDPSIERRSEWNLEESLPLDKGDDKSTLSMQNRDTFIPDISKKIAFEASRGTKQRS